MNAQTAHTPRTDAEEYTSSRYDGEEIPGFDYVSSSFARTLERENALLVEQNEKLNSLLSQMLDAAENADETGYVADLGFIDLDKLHAEVRSALNPPPTK